MTVEMGRPPISAPRPRLSITSRLFGFGSIYGKTIRDSRLATIMVTGLITGLVLGAGKAVAAAFDTPTARIELANLANSMPPVLAGLAGNPVNVGTLGGYFEWKYGATFAIIAALWSILALSSTLAGEARQGSLDLVAAAPFGKRRIAIEKLAAHLTAMTISMVVLAVACWVAGAAFGTVLGDEIPASAAIGFALWVGLIALVSGSIAWVLGPLVGRGAAVGFAAAIMFGGYIVSGYAASVPAFATIANLTWFHWTANHLPLAGQYDWISLVPVAIVAIVLFLLGVELFERRDLGETTTVRSPSLPPAALGLRSPVGRAFGEQIPVALSWGLGIGLFGFVVAAASRSFGDELVKQAPGFITVVKTIYPDFDITNAGGFLQLVFVEFGFIIAGFAAANFVGRWASDETSGRIEMLLATPLSRARWLQAGGIGAFLAVGAMTVIFALAVAFGAGLAGSQVVTPFLGSFSLALFALAMVGVGVGAGGLFRTSFAAEIVALVVIATFLIDLLAPALKLPDWVHQLALTAHLGQPMVGTWDPAGIILCLGIAVGGVLLGTWGMARRDLAD